MSTDIYDFDYEKELLKNNDNFVPLGSKKTKANTMRFSPIVVPDATPVKSAKSTPKPTPVPIPTHISVKRAERPAITTARKAIVQKMPIIVKQDYDYELNRPFSPIQVKPSTRKQNDDDWSSIYDEEFYGGKKRTRKARSTRRKRSRKERSVRSKRRKQTKRSSSRRYRSRKTR